ncbi:RNA-binding protein CP33, chloroplastic-like isoform X2 [Glycine soja]|uniref:RNA-binding protein CP33, chloroplastic-like isoform X2 n=1 Tax=Glycine soja TaxID=3848 RepID=UPI00103E3F30|nr:RNA-binding protein CP33, chloroplastic-like isoform X2 [Glycine soja]
MAATAAAGIASLFSSSINSVKCLRSSKNCSIIDPLITTVPSNRGMFVSHLVEPLSIGGAINSHKLWGPRISAAVAQEEAVVVADDEVDDGAGLVEEEKVEENEGEVVAEQDSDSSATKLYFGNLPYSVDSAKLAGLIQDFGSAELIEEFLGRTLRVNFSSKPKPKEPLYPETEHKLFVGNLSWSVTNEILTQAFQEYGTVVGARVLYDGETGRSRGYGFVCYSTKAEMEAALAALNDVELEGRAMRVSLAQGKRA